MSDSYRKNLKEQRQEEHRFAQYVRILGKGKSGARSLSREEAYQSMTMILRGEVEDIQLGAFLMLLRVNEETPEELAGFAEAVRDHIAKPEQAIAVDLDWSSYAGKKRVLPWFLLSSFLLADNGFRIFMHGASGHTAGRMYTEDVLAELGIAPAQCWREVSDQLDKSSFSYMPLESFCPELHRIIGYRKYLGLRSPVHTLSRLINPLAAPYSIQSIFHPAYGASHQQAAKLLRQPNAAVFKGEGGEIERKPEANCAVKMIVDHCEVEQQWPKMLEGRQSPPEHLDPQHLTRVWRGLETDSYGKNAIVGTAAIAIMLLKKASTQQQAMTLANQWWQNRDRSRV
ncbi:MAG: glycosyl transferase family protein [Oceanicoccus sp.]